MSSNDPTLDALKHLATQKGALLDAFQQIDRLRERVDSHYLRIRKMEEAIRDSTLPPATNEPAMSNKELRLNIVSALDGQLDSLLAAMATAVTPRGGYEWGDGSEDGAQHVDQQWWSPEHGCDSLEYTLGAIRARLVAAVTEWYRSALNASPATDAPAVPREEALRLVAAGIRYGYAAGHDDTVESRYGDPDAEAAEGAPEVLEELDPPANLDASPTGNEPAVPQEGGEPAAVVGEASALPANYIDPEHQGDDRELLRTFYQACNVEGGTADEIHLRGIRAVLAAELAELRSRATPPPVEGGAGELVQWLERMAQAGMGGFDELNAACAATLLQQQATELASWRSRAALLPVPVGERPWEREGWCDAEGRCWVLQGNHWILDYPLRLPVEIYAQVYSFSLPAHAIPLPQAGEGDG